MSANQKAFWSEIESARTRRFEWGSFDCCTFAIRCAIAFTGDTSIETRVRELLGEWKDAREALQAHGGDLRGAVSKILGEPVPWTRLTLGSIALIVDDEGRDVVAVHDGVQLLVPVAIGLRPVSPARAVCGWRLPV